MEYFEDFEIRTAEGAENGVEHIYGCNSEEMLMQATRRLTQEFTDPLLQGPAR